MGWIILIIVVLIILIFIKLYNDFLYLFEDKEKFDERISKDIWSDNALWGRK